MAYRLFRDRSTWRGADVLHFGDNNAANSVAIKGHFEGIINGGDVKLHSGAKVAGEIFYETLSIDSGADVNSSCARRANRNDKAGESVS